MSDTRLDIRVYPIEEPKGDTVAFASIALNDLIAIRGVRVVDSATGAFVSMPQSLDKKTGVYHDVAFALYDDLKKEINKAVLDEYKRTASLEPEERGYEKPEARGLDGVNAEDIKVYARVYPLDDPQGNTKAFANITVENMVAIQGIRVVAGENGLFASMPQSQDKNGDYHDIAFPLNGDLRKEINKLVVGQYESRAKDKGNDKNADKSLANALRKNAEKSAGKPPAPAKNAVAKARHAGTLE
jgi:stage V sporulation protein G